LVAQWGSRAVRFKGRLAVITDGACASACLNVMDDALLYPGVVHLGQATSADTRYLDLDQYAIGDRMGVTIPRKAWFGRLRGNNQPYVPTHVYRGDLGNDEQVRDWALGLISGLGDESAAARAGCDTECEPYLLTIEAR
jgi:hypothetical protein